MHRNATRPPGRSARAMLAKAVTGSAKNMIPKRLIARSYDSAGERVDLRVALLEVDVGDALRLPRGARAVLQHGGGQVDTGGATEWCSAGRQPGHLTVAAPDVEDLVAARLGLNWEQVVELKPELSAS